MLRKIVAPCLFCSALLALFLFFCFHRLEYQDLVNVEFLTSDSVRRTWGDLVYNRLQMGHPPLYFLVTKLWVTIFDHTLTSLYTFTIFLGALGIPVIYFLARELELGQFSWAAALIWSVHPSILYYSRYMRPQIGIIVLCMAFFFILFKNLKQSKVSSKFLLLLLAMAGALWSHLFIFFWLGIFLASFLIPKVRKIAGIEYWFFVITALIFQIVVIGIVKSYIGSAEETLGWIKPITLHKGFEVLTQALGTINVELNKQGFLWMTPILGLLSYFMVFFFNFREKTDPENIDTRDKWNLMFISSLITVAILLGATVIARPLWVPRYLVIILPTVILATVKVLTFIPLRSASIAFILLIVVGMVFNSRWMIENRNSGLRSMIVEFENMYENDQDILLVLHYTSQEALKLYMKKEIDYFLIENNLNRNDALELFSKKIRGRQTIWVLEYPRKISIMRTKMWKRDVEPGKFFEHRNHKTALLGYR